MWTDNRRRKNRWYNCVEWSHIALRNSLAMDASDEWFGMVYQGEMVQPVHYAIGRSKSTSPNRLLETQRHFGTE